MPPLPTFTPTDPRYQDQWHFEQLGDIETIWADYTGAGVTVGVYDDGIDTLNTDLDDNTDLTLVPEINGEQPTLIATKRNDTHGTPVAGLIAAEANGDGVVGVAFEATLGGVNIYRNPVVRNVDTWRQAVDQMDLYDITNHSWGNDDQFRVVERQSTDTVEAFIETSETGRDGLGTIHVKAVANALTHAIAEDLHATRHVIQISASNDEGLVSGYAARGPSLTVISPTDDAARNQTLVTADRAGDFGDSNGDVTTSFGGTSGATPIAAGVIALMLDANPDLGWRDVQDILANSARHTGANPGDDATGTSFYEAQFNGAATWNGGGFHVSEDYGFGIISVHTAVRMAEVWTLFDSAATSANEVTVEGPELRDLEQRINDNQRTIEITLDVEDVQTLSAEHVRVDLSLTHRQMKDLLIELVSPAGTVVTLIDPRLFEDDFGHRRKLAADGFDWPFDVTLFRGEDVNGTWTLRVTDTVDTRKGQIDGLGLTFFGGAATADDVYTYTDEVFWALDLDPDRLTLTDDGGTDWLNLAAMTGDLTVQLNRGASAGDQVFLRIDGDTQIENAVTGDGADLLVGSARSNWLLGMRGDDVVRGKGGRDTIEGGDGADVLRGGGGRDVLRGGAGDDQLSDGGGADRLTGNAGADLFIFGRDGQTDLITDFTLGEDLIRLEGVAAEDITVSTVTAGRVALDYDGERLVLRDGGARALTAEDFQIADILG